jgi:small GTP-binding protein
MSLASRRGDAARQKLLAEERGVLGDLQLVLSRLSVPAGDQETLEKSIRQLDDLFLLVVVGEFNAGKSAFINALLGQKVLEEGVTPTTSRVGLLRYGSTVSREAAATGLDTLQAPVEMLRDTAIVDTPGTNAVLREHEALTREFVPRSDLVLFVTSADRPFTESERAFLQTIRDWGKKIVVALNKVDILETAEDVARVKAFVAENAKALLGLVPEIFPVSARQAFRAKTTGDAALLDESGFPALERFVALTLDAQERFRLKLLNPIGVGSKLLETHLQVAEGRLGLLREDVAAVEEIDAQLALYREDLARDFRFRLADVDNVLHDFERRGDAFFDDTLRLARVLDLINHAKVKAEFEKKVVADLPRLVEKRVDEVIDWVVQSDLKQWRGITERLERRQADHAGRLVGRVEGPFEQDRTRLLDTVRREAQRALETYDQDKEASRLAAGVREAVASTALIQVGALGLGTLVTMLATTTAVDVTGLLAAGAVSVLGLLIIPARRRQAKAELAAKVQHLRTDLVGTLDRQFSRELEKSVQRIQEAIAPYTRFVRGERERLQEIRGELVVLRDALARLRAAVETA